MNAFDRNAALHGQIGCDRGINSTGQHDQRLPADTDRITACPGNSAGHNIGILLMHLDLDA